MARPWALHVRKNTTQCPLGCRQNVIKCPLGCSSSGRDAVRWPPGCPTAHSWWPFFIYCPLRPLRTSWVSHCAHNRLTDMNQPWPRHSKCLSSTLTITNHFSQIGHENKIYGEHKLAHVMSCGIKSCLGPTVKTDMKSASESLSPASVFSQRGFLSTSEDCGCQRLSAVLLTQSSERNESLTPSKLRPFSPQTFSETI